MVRAFVRIAEVAIHNGGAVSFEWPKNCQGWAIRELVEFTAKHGMVEVIVDGCAVGTVNALHQPVLKQWRFIVSPNAVRLIEALTPWMPKSNDLQIRVRRKRRKVHLLTKTEAGNGNADRG